MQSTISNRPSKIPIFKGSTINLSRVNSVFDQSSSATIIKTGPLKSLYGEQNQRSPIRVLMVIQLNGEPVVIKGPRGIRMTRTASVRLALSQLTLNGWGKVKSKQNMKSSNSENQK